MPSARPPRSRATTAPTVTSTTAPVVTAAPPTTAPVVTVTPTSLVPATTVAPGVVPPPTLQPTGLGDDAALNTLAQACYDGDLASCDDLWRQSELGSPYKDFGDTCAGRQPPNTSVWCVDAFGAGAATSTTAVVGGATHRQHGGADGGVRHPAGGAAADRPRRRRRPRRARPGVLRRRHGGVRPPVQAGSDRVGLSRPTATRAPDVSRRARSRTVGPRSPAERWATAHRHRRPAGPARPPRLRRRPHHRCRRDQRHRRARPADSPGWIPPAPTPPVGPPLRPPGIPAATAVRRRPTAGRAPAAAPASRRFPSARTPASAASRRGRRPRGVPGHGGRRHAPPRA